MLDYLRHPQGTRDPNPFFSNRAYLAALGGRDTGGLAPLVHYLEQGAAEGLPAFDVAHPAFDAVYYAGVYPDVRASDLPPLAHFLRIGLAEGRYPKARPPSPIDLFDDAAIAAPVPAPPERITDEAEAVRFLIALLRARPDLRQRFPDALSAGAEGAFAVWLAKEGAVELGLSGKALAPIAAAFRADPGARIRQMRLIHADVARAHLLALTPAGAGDLLAAVAADGTLGGEPIDLAHLWWFLLTVAEKPADGLVETFLFTPVWQRLFPDGVTVFGRRRLGEWLVASFGIAGDWTEPARWPEPFTSAEQIRIAYAARADWRAAYPAPFADTAAAEAFLVWQGTPAAGLDEEATAWLVRQDRAALATELAMPGFNMLGHFCYASGLRTSAETLVEGFPAAQAAPSHSATCGCRGAATRTGMRLMSASRCMTSPSSIPNPSPCSTWPMTALASPRGPRAPTGSAIGTGSWRRSPRTGRHRLIRWTRSGRRRASWAMR
ncbi:hypothetical protein ABIC16_004236 [Sphingomonas sp. PvP055]|uniref:hypothetical protein n=1 Tax=Sphingomonas sp. PvP055 TaxID=3156391 RepID=UPI003396252E